MELIGIPHRLVVSERGLNEGSLEYKGRRDSESQPVPVDGVPAFFEQRIRR
jgi:prolyl-tRNA synthetase